MNLNKTIHAFTIIILLIFIDALSNMPSDSLITIESGTPGYINSSTFIINDSVYLKLNAGSKKVTIGSVYDYQQFSQYLNKNMPNLLEYVNKEECKDITETTLDGRFTVISYGNGSVMCFNCEECKALDSNGYGLWAEVYDIQRNYLSELTIKYQRVIDSVSLVEDYKNQLNDTMMSNVDSIRYIDSLYREASIISINERIRNFRDAYGVFLLDTISIKNKKTMPNNR